MQPPIFVCFEFGYWKKYFIYSAPIWTMQGSKTLAKEGEGAIWHITPKFRNHCIFGLLKSNIT